MRISLSPKELRSPHIQCHKNMNVHAPPKTRPWEAYHPTEATTKGVKHPGMCPLLHLLKFHHFQNHTMPSPPFYTLPNRCQVTTERNERRKLEKVHRLIKESTFHHRQLQHIIHRRQLQNKAQHGPPQWPPKAMRQLQLIVPAVESQTLHKVMLFNLTAEVARMKM